MVGGGGASGKLGSDQSGSFGGGGGGYTKTLTNIGVDIDLEYPIIIGAGGTSSNGGNTLAFSESVSGGDMSTIGCGAVGGSGGGDPGSYSTSFLKRSGPGGSDGSNGYAYNQWGELLTSETGIGQGYTTREFGEATGTLYAGGGGGGFCDSTSNSSKKKYAGAGGAGGGGAGGNNSVGENGEPNTGGGGGGNGYDPIWTIRTQASGGSGIVIIRNTRGITYG